MRITVLGLVWGLVLTAPAVFGQTMDDLVFLTEEFPPYNFVQDGHLVGSSPRVVEQLFHLTGSHQTLQTVQVLPWARAYREVLENPRAALFTVTRLPEREGLFKWVGPLTEARNVLLARKDHRIKLTVPREILPFTIGVVRDDAGQTLVDSLGYDDSRLVKATTALSCLKMLDKGYIDLFAFDENVSFWLLREAGLNPDDFEVVYTLAIGQHYIALNPAVPDSLVQSLQNQLNALRKSGRLKELIAMGLKGM